MHILLEYPEEQKVLCFRGNGREYYKTHLRHYFNSAEQLEVSHTIEFPSHIRAVTAQYLYGMFYELYARIGIDGIIQHFNIIGSGLREDPKRNLVNEIKRWQ